MDLTSGHTKGDHDQGCGVPPQVAGSPAGIGGCLLYPLVFLAAQPVMFVLMFHRVSTLQWPGMQVSRTVFLPYLLYDLLLLGCVTALLWLFLKKRAVLPALFVAFLVSFSVLSGVLANALWRLPEARVVSAGMGNPTWSHFVMLLQCLLLVPYFSLDPRVKQTFTRAPEQGRLLDRLVRPLALPADRLYARLTRRGKKVYLISFGFVVLVFLLDFIVDTLVLNLFL